MVIHGQSLFQTVTNNSTLTNLNNTNLNELPHHSGTIQTVTSSPINTHLTNLSPHQYPSTANHDNPSYHINHPFNQQLLPNHNLIFNSQSLPPFPQNLNRHNLTKTTGPHKINHKNHKNRTGPILTLNRTVLEPSQSIAAPSQTEPDKQTDSQFQEDDQTMEIHSEKKRRREAENQPNQKQEESNLHFLSAGPGSQDCREQ
jgi:hypothetical protein